MAERAKFTALEADLLGEQTAIATLAGHYIGTIRATQTGGFEFVPHRGGAFCTKLALPRGSHLAPTFAEIKRAVGRLVAAAQARKP